MVQRSLRLPKVLGSMLGQGSKYDKFLRYEKYSVTTVIQGYTT